MKHVANIDGRIIHNSLMERGVNVGLLLDTIDALKAESHTWEGGKVRFDMGTWFFPSLYCGTAACLAGHIVLQAGHHESIKRFLAVDRTQPLSPEIMCIANDAIKLVGLTSSEGKSMFSDYTSSNVGGREAIAMLERFLATGQVQWSEC